MKPNLFIVFEGIDGCGKTTQANLLQDHIKTFSNHDVVLVSDPGTTQIGKNIRQLLINNKSTSYIETELFLYFAARSQLVREIIIPALNSNKIVISDRYTLSTEAYQGIYSSLNKIISLGNRCSSYNILPTITYLIDLDIRDAIPRKNDLATLTNQDINRYDEIREKYLQLSSKNNITILDGILNKNNIHNTILDDLLRSKLYEPTRYDNNTYKKS